MNEIICEDVKNFAKHFDLTDQLAGASFLITGATGLIGSSLIRCLLALNEQIKVYAPVRNLKKAEDLFDEWQKEHIRFIECDLVEYDYSLLEKIDYIVHCAAPTSSKFFVEHPVETSEIIMDGTKKMLQLARQKQVQGMVYLSSLEVYGESNDDSLSVKEDFQGYLNPMSVRSSYPMAKRATENLCCLYASEYGVPVKIARLTQTTGAGIAKDDSRIIAQFARLAAEGRDIVLHESTYISARGMADFIHENINPNCHVKIELADNMGYAPPTKLRLDAGKLMRLGWNPRYGLKEIFERLIEYLS